ncbi:hypothetical protein [Nesterenkonia alkaliphila]|uniref:Uncharacterized protein n=1 Tax=Nesterenkonia alkaliphila TaxID=1463631 RepID=A0A7K1UJF9_9MICC|nr:hypothetical protein [Nesterenkonia alkaliphila]MVT26609.1 hypothetical protein [Nesterenkonia alkaliphila]GFZ92183.1 hypothetical protein GCM10011359_21840 [Nesterenkonia alkaliphila]
MLALSLLAAACAGDEGTGPEAAEPALVEEAGANNGDTDDQESEDAPEPEPAAPEEEDEEASNAADAPQPATDPLDTLFADSVHNGIASASPSSAYIEVDGQRFEFGDVSCSIVDEPDQQHFAVTAVEEATGHLMYFSRSIGENIGFNWEDEHVQLSLLTTPGDEGELDQYSNSMAQHDRERGAAPEWFHGSGTSPLIRVVGSEATASGVLTGIPFAEAPTEGPFIAAVAC